MKKNYFFKTMSNSLQQKLLINILFFCVIAGFNKLQAQTCNLNAGNPQVICETEAFILGSTASINEATTSNPQWTQISGPSVIIQNSTNEIAQVIGFVGGYTYTFRLSATCNDNSGTNYQDVSVRVNSNTQANAGGNLQGCPGTYSLSGNNPGAGETGTWTISGGNPAGVTIANPSSPNSNITLNQSSAGSTTLRWTFTNGLSSGDVDYCETTDTMIVTNLGGQIPVDAGPNLAAYTNVDECYDTYQSVTMNASIGGNGNGQIGTWSLVSGPNNPSFSGVNNRFATVGNLIEGTYVLRWSVSGPCATGSDTVSIEVPPATQENTDANAGANQIFCLGVTSTVLSGNTPLYAGETIEWIQTGGPNLPPGSIVSPNEATTVVNNLDGSSNYSFSYTITAPNLGNPAYECDSTDYVNVRYTNDPLTIELNNGNDIELLPADVTSITVPISFTGGNTFNYQLISGPSTPNYNYSGGNMTFSNLNNIGTYVIRVRRSSNGSIATDCGIATDDITLIVSRTIDGVDPMIANAGTNSILPCNQPSTILAGNNPALTPPGDTNTYTGYWTQVSGPSTAVFDDPTLFNATASSLILGLYTFRWHMSGGLNAPASTDDTEVLVSFSPNSIITTPSGPACSGDFLLEAAPLAYGETGVWVQTDANPPITFTNSTEPNTYVALSQSSIYSFDWVVSSPAGGACNYSTSVTISTDSNTAPSPSLAGADQCLSAPGNATMNADNTGFLTTNTTGTWTLISSPSGSTPPSELTSDENNPTVNFTGLIAGEYVFQWETATPSGCATAFTDTVSVWVADSTIYAANDGSIADICETSTLASITMSADDPSVDGLIGTWIQIDGNNTWVVDNINSPTATFSNLVPGHYEFEWLVNKGTCGTSSSTVSFNVNLQTGPAALNNATDSVCAETYNSNTSLGSDAAQAITNGAGIWSVVSGPSLPSISNVNDTNLVLSGLVTGEYTFRWTAMSSNPYCAPTAPNTADFTLTVDTPASAGADINLCNANTVLLQGNVGATGVWTGFNDTTSLPVLPIDINTISGYTASATIVPGNNYTFTFTTGSACGAADDVIVVNSAPPVTPDAGSNQEICLGVGVNTVTMTGNDVSTSTGTWTKVSGPAATINDVNSNITDITLSDEGIYLFRWTSSNGNCVGISSDMKVFAYEEPSTADIITTTGNACQFNTILEADEPVNGIGTWTLTSTPGGYTPGDLSINSPNNSTSEISIVNPYTLELGDYEFTWTVTNGTICTPSVATITLSYNGVPPTSPNAGPDQFLCDAVSTVLNANTISPGTGTWNQVGTSPSIAIFTNAFDPNTSVSNLIEGEYEFMWTSNNGGCSFNDTVKITITESVAPANAGVNQTISQFDNLQLNGNDPAPIVGTWSFVSGPSTPIIINVNNPNTQIGGTIPGTYEFMWTVENSPCATSSDNVIINITPIVDLSLEKMSNTLTPNVGSTVDFTLTITNNGINDGTGISVLDELPTGLALVPGSISNGGVFNSGGNEIIWTGLNITDATSLDLTYQAVVLATGSYLNSAEITALDQFDPNSTPGNKATEPLEDDTDELTLTPVPIVNISLEKTINNSTPYVGSNVVFTLSVTNSGPSNATGVEVTDYLPTGYTLVSTNLATTGDPTIVWDVGGLTNGETKMLQITATVNATGNYTNTVEVTDSNEIDSNSTPDNGVGNSEDDEDSSTPIPIPASDLELTKTVNDATPNVGETVTFTIIVNNNGDNIATNVDVYDYLPTGFSYDSHTVSTGTYTPVTGSWVIPTLGVGNANQVTLTVDAVVLPTGQYTNFAEIVGADQYDPDSTPGNNDIVEDDHDAANINPINVADLITTKTVDNANPVEGATITYIISVLNNGGPTAATGVSLTDILPTGVTYVSDNSSGAYNHASGVWTIGNIAVNATETLNIIVTVDAGTQGTSILNTTSTATGDQTDPALVAGNDLSETIAVNAFPIAVNDESLGNAAGAVTITNITAANSTTIDSDSDGTIEITTINLIAPVDALSVVTTSGDIVGFEVFGEGIWALTEAGAVTFTPEAGFTANPTPINYTIEDNDGDVSNEASITITYVVLAPVPQDDLSSSNSSGPVTVNPFLNNGSGLDTDSDGSIDPTQVSLVPTVTATSVVTNVEGNVTSFIEPGEGTWEVNLITGSITFTPESNFTEDPTPVDYNIEDNDGNESLTNATVTIDYVPVAVNDESLGNTVGGDVTINVTGNDTAGDVVVNTTFVFVPTLPGTTVITGTPGQAGYQADVEGEGVWTYDGAGNLTFNPDAGFTIDPSPIDYTIDDAEGNTSNTATVLIGYDEEPPVALNDGITGVATGADAIVVDLTANDTLSDGSVVDTTPGIGNATLVLDETSVPGGVLSGGGLIVTVPNEGVWTYNPTTDNLTFEPALGFTANPTPITYVLTETLTGLSATAVVTAGYIAEAPVPQDDLSSSNSSGPVTVNPFLNNGSGLDTDSDGSIDPTQVSLVPTVTATSVVTNVEGNVTSFIEPGEGTWEVNLITGSITFTPESNFTEDPTPVDYNIEDNDGNESLTNATVTIDYVPVAVNDISTIVGIIGSPVSIDVTLNDLDGDVINSATVVLDATSVGGLQVSASEVSLLNVGTWLDDGLGNVTFTPDAAYTLDPPVIEYTINDDEGNTSNEATIAFDYAPIATTDLNDNGGLGHSTGSTVIVDVLINDTTGDTYDTTTVSLVNPGTAINIVADYNGDITSFEIPGEGTWNVNFTTGAITFIPTAGFILNPTPINYNVEDDEGNQSNDAEVVILYELHADISILKTDGTDIYTPGTPIIYTITVINNGPIVATNIEVLDDIVGALESVTTWSGNGNVNVSGDLSDNIVSLNANNSVIYTVTINVPSGYTGDIVNTATANSLDVPDPNANNNSSTDTNQVALPISDLELTKVVDNPTPFVGDEVTFTITVVNNGPSDAEGIDVVDYLPSGYTLSTITLANPSQGTYSGVNGLWVVGNLADQASATLEITAIVNAAGDYTNFAEINYANQEDPDSYHGNNNPDEDDQDEAIVTPIPVSNLVWTKTIDNNTPNINDEVTYAITVVNNGPSVATGVNITDKIPEGLTYVSHIATGGDINSFDSVSGLWNIGTVNTNDSSTLILTVSVNNNQGGNTLNNVLTNINLNETDPTNIGDDLNEIITVTSADLVTTKIVNNSTPDEGDVITYTIRITNNGPSDATGVNLVDLLPIGVTYISDNANGAYNSGDGNWMIGEIASDETVTLEIMATVNEETAGMTITNETTAAIGDQSDPTIVGDDLEATIVIQNLSDLVVSKVVDNNTPNAGDVVTYTITITNNGAADATNLVVTDMLPVGLTYGSIVSPSTGTWTAPDWKIGTLSSGAAETIVIEAIVGLDQGGMTLTNTVSHTQDQVDSNLTEDDVSETIVVTGSDLATIKTVSNEIPNEGEIITYTIAVTNNGPSTATNVSLFDNLPVGVTFVNYSTEQGIYNYGSGLWTIGDLVNGATVKLEIQATVDDGTLGQIIINSTSPVQSDQSDPNKTNNVGSVSIVPTAYIDLSLTKNVVGDLEDLEVGDMVTFEIRVANEGPTEATGVQVTDMIPSGYAYFGVYSSSIGTYDKDTGIWNIGFIEVGNTAVLLIDVRVLKSGDYMNCAEITAANEIDIDSTPNNGNNAEDDYDCASALPIQELDLRIEKSVVADNLTPMVGDEVSFEIRLINDGNIEGTEVVVTDLLPSGYTFLNYSSTRGTYDYDNGEWIVGTIINGETEVLVVDAIVNAAGDYLNCATITEMYQTDMDLSNNTSCIVTTPVKVADLELTKDVDIYEPYAETNVDFTINLTNQGPSNASGVKVKDLLPSGYTFVSATATVGSYNEVSGVWDIGNVLVNETETLVITAYVLSIGDWVNVAEVITSNELDLDSTPGNNDSYEDDQDEQKTEPVVLLTISEGFSPNGDGINDKFEIEFLEVLYPNFAMEIVDRYGNIVYTYKHNGDPYTSPRWWDGFSSGRMNFSSEILPAGTYFYTIYFNNDDREPKTGWVYLRK